MKLNTNEIMELRNQGMTLQEIADIKGTNRERVRRSIGNTGRNFISNFVKKNIVITPEMTKQELLDMKVKSKSVLLSMFAKIHHKVSGGGTASRGADAETIVSEKLEELGIKNKLMPHGHPFDVLLENEKKVDVKASYLPRPLTQRRKTNLYQFQVSKDKRGNYCDFFICYIATTKDFFVIPNEEVGVVSNICITWPKPKGSWAKWHQYHNRFDLLR